MSAEQVEPKLLAWGVDNMEPGTLEQAARAARLPFVHGHVALMPDAHVGIGATVGSVIPTIGAIIPAAVGVDIGCGMIAVETDAPADRLPDDLGKLMPLIEERLPAGVGKGHNRDVRGSAGDDWLSVHPTRAALSDKQVHTVLSQFGTLGSGNHFVEVCLDERDHVWIVLHSGSRGIGNQLAKGHIDGAVDHEAMARAEYITTNVTVQAADPVEADLLAASMVGHLGIPTATRRVDPT